MLKNLKDKLLLLALAALVAGCSGFGTTMTKVKRLGQNKGYEIQSPMPVVQQATADMLKERGYDVSFMPDKENGAGGAGLIVIGNRIDKFQVGKGGNAAAVPGGDQRDIRKLINVYLSKKWRMGSDEPAPNLTLVKISSSSYRRKETGGPEEESPSSDEFKALLRNEIERRSAAAAEVESAGEVNGAGKR